VTVVLHEQRRRRERPPEESVPPVLLEIQDVHKTYRNGVKANDGITLNVDAGEVFGLLGPNGAGKTTLVGQVIGYIAPTAGSIRIDGVDVIQRPGFARQACSYQPQLSVPIEGLAPIRAIEMAGRIRGGKKENVLKSARALIETLDLGEWAERRVQLSGGVARLIAFIMACVVPGQIVILDEPTNDVDPLRRKLLWNQVRKLADEGSAVLLVTHNVLEAERCVDRLAIIDHGRVLSSGTAAAVKADQSGWLRMEVVLEPDAGLPTHPEFLHRAATVGRRLIGEIETTALPKAIEWATRLRDTKRAEEFSIGPITLEDVYIRQVRSEPAEEDLEEAGAA
jgi:ABC-2 type transport system ATP-binding protein